LLVLVRAQKNLSGT
ncbi:S1 RNA binding domain protein, partial [Vibrio parahaemolyticus AQ3810]